MEPDQGALTPRSEREILTDLRTTCASIIDAIARLPPKTLIGYLWGQILLSLISRHSPETDSLPSISHQENVILFAMEYIHATLATRSAPESTEKFTEEAARSIVDLCARSLQLCFEYQLASSIRRSSSSISDNRLAFQILSTWIMIRGRRFQVLEEEFFSYVLKPHDEAIKSTYGITSDEFAEQIQKVADSPRTGFDKAHHELERLMNASRDRAANATKSGEPEEVFEISDSEKEEFLSVYDDLFTGGLFNLSKQSSLPHALLSDLSFAEGENNEFDDGSLMAGTPLRTLPARIKPLIRLDGDFYCTEPNFVRDATYRSLQRALIARNPDYREKWNSLQKKMSEEAFFDLMRGHLKGASAHTDVYYPIGPNRWAETDCVILIDDVLINVEAKAGAEALAAPAEDLASHIRTIEKLILASYKQCTRFLQYVFSTDEAPIYKRLPSGKYLEVARIRSSQLRKVFPIGLTVEGFTPFSAGIKETNEISTVTGKHHFFSMSIDDLLVIRRILRGTGEFLHYLDVRQSLASMKDVMLFDEIDHLGAYVSRNRADATLKEMMQEHGADHIWVDGMDQDVIAPYFMHPDWPNCPAPSQKYPEKTLELLSALERSGGSFWLDADSFIRDHSSEGRKDFANNFAKVAPTLTRLPWSFFALSGEETALFGLVRFDNNESTAALRRKAEALCLALGVREVRLFILIVSNGMAISSARMEKIKTPPMIRADFPALQHEANLLRPKIARLPEVGKP